MHINSIDHHLLPREIFSPPPLQTFRKEMDYIRLEERSITSTKLAYHMQSHEFNDFWKEIRKQNKAKSALSNCVAGVTGETAIADMWRDHYEELLNSTASTHEKEDI